MTTYILLKSRPALKGTPQNYEAIRSVLTLALFVSANKISAASPHLISKSSVRYNPSFNEADTPELPLWHYRNYVKGFRFGEVWIVDADIRSDEMLIKNFRDLYGGIVDDENYSSIKSFVQLKAQINSLRDAQRMADYRLFHIESSEQSYIGDAIKTRLDSLQAQVDKYPVNLIKRRF